MTDPAVQNYLFAEAERTMKALLDNRLVSTQDHAQVSMLLKQAKDRSATQMVQAQPLPAKQGEPVAGYPFGPPPPMGYNPYSAPMQQQQAPPQQVGYMSQQSPYPGAYPAAYPAAYPGQGAWPQPYNPAQPAYAPPQISQPVQAAPEAAKPVPAAAPPAPEKPHQPSKVGQFASQMGHTVVNSMGHGFGWTIGSSAAHDLWGKVTNRELTNRELTNREADMR